MYAHIRLSHRAPVYSRRPISLRILRLSVVVNSTSSSSPSWLDDRPPSCRHHAAICRAARRPSRVIKRPRERVGRDLLASKSRTLLETRLESESSNGLTATYPVSLSDLECCCASLTTELQQLTAVKNGGSSSWCNPILRAAAVGIVLFFFVLLS